MRARSSGDRASGSGPEGRGSDSLRAHHIKAGPKRCLLLYGLDLDRELNPSETIDYMQAWPVVKDILTGWVAIEILRRIFEKDCFRSNKLINTTYFRVR